MGKFANPPETSIKSTWYYYNAVIVSQENLLDIKQKSGMTMTPVCGVYESKREDELFSAKDVMNEYKAIGAFKLLAFFKISEAQARLFIEEKDGK